MIHSELTSVSNNGVELNDGTRLYPMGERALVLDASHSVATVETAEANTDDAILATQRRIWRLAHALQMEGGLLEVVPGMHNLTVLFNPLARGRSYWQRTLAALWQQAKAAPSATEQQNAASIEIEVDYSPAAAIDLHAVASETGLSTDAVIELHCQASYTVMFIGFQPGFAYLHGLPEALITARKSTPATRVPAGSVAIAGAQTAIYPFASPGGWHIIGRSDVALFNPERNPAALLKAGDTVHFVRAIRGTNR